MHTISNEQIIIAVLALTLFVLFLLYRTHRCVRKARRAMRIVHNLQSDVRECEASVESLKTEESYTKERLNDLEEFMAEMKKAKG